MAGHISFLSHESMNEKFGREYKRTDGLYELFGKFQVERYLEYNGYNFSKKFDANSYLYLSKAINIFDLSRGYESLNKAISNIKAKLYLISFKEDKLFLPYEMQEIQEECMKLDIKSTHTIIDSSYGHDAFLVEVDKFKDKIQDALKYK
jgi:homoserine O-acetyltransferase